MATFNNNTITANGRTLIREVMTSQGQKSIEFTHIAIGDGDAPVDSDNATALTHNLFELPIGKIRQHRDQEGVFMLSSTFTSNRDRGGFYLREIACFARLAGSKDEPVMFCYANSAEKADYIPSVDDNSVCEQSILLVVSIGSASVMLVDNPNAQASFGEIDDTLRELTNDLGTAKTLFVKKSGDTMQGNLSMDGGAKFIGDLQGNVTGHASLDLPISGGFMTGDLSMGDGAKFIGDLQGNVTGHASLDLPISGGSMTGDLSMGDGAKFIGDLQGNVTGDVTGHASLDLPISGGFMTGDLSMDGGAKFIGDLQGNVTGDVTGHASLDLPISGGSMTGDLSMDGGAKFIGDLQGNATSASYSDNSAKFNGWQIFNSIADMNATLGTQVDITSNTLHAIAAAMPANSILYQAIASAYNNMPHSHGTLEVRKLNSNRTCFTFTASTGQIFTAHASDTASTQWVSSMGAPVGTIEMYAGAIAPGGYLFCRGQAVSRTTYAGLFSVIGTTYGTGDNTSTFNLPDLRGVFPRGLDTGRGFDNNRKLGTFQDSGAPNISGTVAGMDAGTWYMNNKPNFASGAFWQDMNDNTGDINDGGGHYSGTRAVKMSASRCSAVYGRSADVRPRNIALNFIIKY